MDRKEDIRVWQRHPYEIPVTITCDNGFSTKAYTLDFSEGGMRIIAPLCLVEGQQIQLHISLENISLKPLVKVRRVDKEKDSVGTYTLALQFLYLSHEEKIELEKLFEHIKR